MTSKLNIYSIFIIFAIFFGFFIKNANAVLDLNPDTLSYPEIMPYSLSVGSITDQIPYFIYLILLSSPLLIIFSYYLYHKIIKQYMEFQIEPRQIFIKINTLCLILSFAFTVLLFAVGIIYLGVPINEISRGLISGYIEVAVLFIFFVILSLFFLASGIELFFLSRINKDFLKPSYYFTLLFVFLFMIIAVALDYIDYIRSNSFI